MGVGSGGHGRQAAVRVYKELTFHETIVSAWFNMRRWKPGAEKGARIEASVSAGAGARRAGQRGASDGARLLRVSWVSCESSESCADRRCAL